jgi:outer membrane protein assembly factor BamB
MKKTIFALLFVLVLLSSLLTGCTGGAAVATSWPGVTASEDTVYLANNAFVFAINLDNGGEKWRFPAERDNKISFYAAPALTKDGQLIVGGYDNKVYSLNPTANGQQNWVFEQATDRFVGSPLSTENGIYAPSSDTNLYALTEAGQLRWSFASEHSFWSAPTAGAGMLYLASMDHNVYALDPESGEQIWASGELGGAMSGSPVIDGSGKLFIGTYGSEMLALDANTGKVIWRTPASNWIWSSPALDNGILYYGDINGVFYAVDAATGAIKWQIDPDTATPKAITGRPLVLEGTVYFGTESGTLFAADGENGTILWSKPLGGKIQSDLVLAGDVILVAINGSETVLVALDGGGNQKWAFIPAK